MRPIQRQEIVSIAKGRAYLETELAKKMYSVFNSVYITQLRDLIGLATEQIVVLASKGTVTKRLYELSFDKNLAVWNTQGGGGKDVAALEIVLRNKNQWTAADCSDLIRLFGGIIENPTLQRTGHVGKDVDDVRDAQRPGGLGVWGAPRARGRKGYHPTPQAPHIHAAHNAMLRARRDPGFAGIKKTHLLDVSTVKRIDFVFGLAEGCDISGTTADSIFFIRHVNSFIRGFEGYIHQELLPAVQLLPMATMVSQAHHTLLECALTLTLNKIINYRIGFYQSLLPPGHVYPPLRDAFEWADRDCRNKRILCYRDANGLTGRLFKGLRELDVYYEAARVSTPFMIDFLNMKPNPSIQDLERCKRFERLLALA